MPYPETRFYREVYEYRLFYHGKDGKTLKSALRKNGETAAGIKKTKSISRLSLLFHSLTLGLEMRTISTPSPFPYVTVHSPFEV
jgi:hypothetical protein